MMLWALLSVMAGFFDAVVFSSMKKVKHEHLYVTVWARFTLALPFLLLFLFFLEDRSINSVFLAMVVLEGITIAVAIYLIVKATKHSKLSICIPMLSFTPLFLLFTSNIMVGEFPSNQGIVGVLLIVLGAYILNIVKVKKGFLKPIKVLFKEKGAKYVLIVALIYSFSANFTKIGVQHGDPILFAILTYTFIILITSPMVFLKYQENLHAIKYNLKYLIIMGFAAGMMFICVSFAMRSALVPYVISLKRSSVIFSIILGYFLYNEDHFTEHLIGGFVMVAGGTLIIFS